MLKFLFKEVPLILFISLLGKTLTLMKQCRVLVYNNLKEKEETKKKKNLEKLMKKELKS